MSSRDYLYTMSVFYINHVLFELLIELTVQTKRDLYRKLAWYINNLETTSRLNSPTMLIPPVIYAFVTHSLMNTVNLIPILICNHALSPMHRPNAYN